MTDRIYYKAVNGLEYTTADDASLYGGGCIAERASTTTVWTEYSKDVIVAKAIEAEDKPVSEVIDYVSMPKLTLQELAKARGIPDWGILTKVNLVKKLEEANKVLKAKITKKISTK